MILLTYEVMDIVLSNVTPRFTAFNEGVIILPENEIHKSEYTLFKSCSDDISRSLVLSSLI